MNEAIYRELPIMLSTTLYKYNHLDNKIISALKNYSFVLKKTKDVIIVPAEELFTILKTRFNKDIDEAASFPQDRLIHGVNTAFQLYHLLNYYVDSKAVSINISMAKDYSKVIEGQDGGKMVALDYKIDKAMVRYDDYFSIKDIRLLNGLLKEIKIIDTIKPQSSYSLYLGDYLDKIDKLDSAIKTKYKKIIEFNDEIFADKLRMDNPFTIIVTDHLKK